MSTVGLSMKPVVMTPIVPDGRSLAPPTADPDEVYSVLQSRKDSVGPKVPVIIKPTEDVKWRFVVEAFNAAVRAKLDNITFGSTSG